jgi:amino acid transporter
MTGPGSQEAAAPLVPRRSLRFMDLVLYGIILIQPTAPMPVFGVLYEQAHGHVATTILLAMIAMLLTAVSYGRMARIYPAGGSAFLYVGKELHPALGYLCGWCLTLDYVLNPLICTIWSSKAAAAFLPAIPYAAWVLFFAALFTLLNLAGVETSARINALLAAILVLVVAIFLAAAARWMLHGHPIHGGQWLLPLFDRKTFNARAVLHGTSIAVLTYIGFDGISTLADEAREPRRDIPRAIVMACLIAGVLAAIEVYAAQLVLPPGKVFANVETAYPEVGRLIGGWLLFSIVNGALLLATIGSGMASQMGAARLLYAMGRDGAIPGRFFGALAPKRLIPQNNVLLIGAVCVIGGFLMSYELGAELLNYGALVAFIMVNIAAARRVWLELGAAGVLPLLASLLGCAVCALLWGNLSALALEVGTLWAVLGIVLGLLNWRRQVASGLGASEVRP